MAGLKRMQKTPPVGSRHYRAYVGPYDEYDIKAAMQFNLLTFIGLREHHFLLDVGCGSLRLGRLLIPYLGRRRYVGLERQRWLVDAGIANELGTELIQKKRPRFVFRSDFRVGRPSNGFDFVNVHSVFCHAPLASVAMAMARLGTVIGANGLIAATFAVGDADYSEPQWRYPDVVRYRKSTIHRTARAAGLASVAIGWSHPRQNWFLLARAERRGTLRRWRDRIRQMRFTSPFWLKSDL